MTWKRITSKDLSDELMKRFNVDQDVRIRMDKAKDRASQDSFIPEMLKIDTDNTEFIKSQMSKGGFPGESQVGEEAATAAYMLVQHSQDRALQSQVLDIMKAAPKGEHQPQNIAFLHDRVQVDKDGTQTYGTQFFDEGKGIKLRPIIDPEKLDERRKGMGLGPHKDYLKEWGL